MTRAARRAKGAPIPTMSAFAFMYIEANRYTLQYLMKGGGGYINPRGGEIKREGRREGC